MLFNRVFPVYWGWYQFLYPQQTFRWTNLNLFEYWVCFLPCVWPGHDLCFGSTLCPLHPPTLCPVWAAFWLWARHRPFASFLLSLSSNSEAHSTRTKHLGLEVNPQHLVLGKCSSSLSSIIKSSPRCRTADRIQQRLHPLKPCEPPKGTQIKIISKYWYLCI